MGLTVHSTGHGVSACVRKVHREQADGRVVALAGNPNVGKSTVFNALTNGNQHTGNWPGKTVASAQGRYDHGGRSYLLVDLPGTYSLLSHSAEEEVARDFICLGGADATIVVCDATCLERNLNLVLQILEITPQVVVCVNLLDEARRKGIHIDLQALSGVLGVPVVGTEARSGRGLQALTEAVEKRIQSPPEHPVQPIHYLPAIEEAVALAEPAVAGLLAGSGLSPRWATLRLLDGDEALCAGLEQRLGLPLREEPAVRRALQTARERLEEAGIPQQALRDRIVSCLVLTAEEICLQCVCLPACGGNACHARDRRIDRFLISRRTGIPIMLLLLCGVFWLTISGANLPSQLLADGLFWVQDRLTDLFFRLGAPDWLHGALVLGMWRTLAWVVSVMLPPMAIFFPLFTLLEDFGYLPRVAFNLDHHFKRANACGKQALTMCMGFGCNAAGVVGCRIIDSPRERLIAILTNNFVPCNGRFPTLIALISMFFLIPSGLGTGLGGSLLSALLLTGVILLGVVLTFLVSRLLSATLLRGVPSSFTLELPPYRRPQIGKVIVRSLCDRTLFVLGRAAVVAAPAGLLLWVLANITVGGQSLLLHAAGWLDPFASLLGLDGVILLAFFLGFPANEIVLPIILMAYLSTGSLIEMEDLGALHTLLVQNGWTWQTAVCTMLFCLIHFPCSTTCLTIRRETGSFKWTLLAFLLPTAIGMTVCFLFHSTMLLLN